ncbi:coiled-coil domain-containing protein 117 isoform X2 [Rhincodon typus]|uniref:coiled-coil domain-containing protein 117 isoform X2 n=1 Tax=Rhincodon typus TaxID=259920 RepID=UPI00202F4D56|nr:coiled-coil domain-containing protein 117 isoform X2 [Rhincodon typus]
MVMAHSLCYSSLTPSGRQLFQSPTLEVYGRNASCAAARIQNPLCWQTDCFVPAHTSTTHLEGKGCKQGDGISESMDTSVESPENNPVLSAVRTTTTNAELKNPPLRNESFFRRKHKREQEEDDAPARKKRLTEKMLDCLVTSVNVSCSSWPYTFNPQESGISDVASPSWQIGPSSQEFRVIENEATYVDMKPDPSEEGLQKLKEIENRLVEGDDPEGDGIEVSDMPVLVLSDSLREELRPGLEEILPRRIMESLTVIVPHNTMQGILNVKTGLHHSVLKEMATPTNTIMDICSRQIGIAHVWSLFCGDPHVSHFQINLQL